MLLLRDIIDGAASVHLDCRLLDNVIKEKAAIDGSSSDGLGVLFSKIWLLVMVAQYVTCCGKVEKMAERTLQVG